MVLEGVRRRFGTVDALAGLDLVVPANRITVLLGPNGAGKTTAIRMITGALDAHSGTVRTFGLDPARRGEEVRLRCGVVSAKPALYDRLDAHANLSYAAELYGMGRGPAVDARIRESAARFGIDPARTLVAGFSSGAMLVWTLACERGADFAGFVPMSGTFWAPVPQSCPEIPANLMHFQGTEDTTVPMEGRPIEEAHQGNLDQAFTLAESLSDFGPPETTQEGDLTCTRRTDSAGRILDLCLFPGGHSFRPDFIARAAADFLPPP